MSTRLLIPIVLIVAAMGGGVWLVTSGALDSERDVTTNSDVAYEHYLDGRAHLERYAFEDAIEAYQAAAAADTNFAMAYLGLGRAQARLGRTVLARVSMKKAFDKREHASELERLWIERNEAAVSRKFEVAASITDDLVSRFGDHPWVLRLQGDIAREEQRLADAVEFYRRGLELDHEAVDLHNLLGYAYLAMGKYEEAIQSLERYAFYAPDQANPHDSLGEAYLATGRYDDATQEFLTALELDPAFLWSALHLADVLTVTGQIDRAHRILDDYEELMLERGWSDQLALARIMVDMYSEQWTSLIPRANELLRDVEIMSKPSELMVFAFFARTMAQLELGDLDAATASLDQLTDTTEKFFASLSQYPWYQKAEAINRALVNARFARAQGRPEEGIEELATAIADSDASPHRLAFFRYHLALGQYDAGLYEDAAATAMTALEKIPTLPNLNFVAAMAKVKLGEREEALDHLRVYLEVMRRADEGHPGVARATRMFKRLVPRS